MKNIILAEPRGFCAGVSRAVDIVDILLDNFSEPVYVRHEIVHNKFVVDRLKNKGAVFVQNICDIPSGAICVFSAHGVSTEVVEDAKKRDLQIFDATCPLVTKVHMQVAKASRNDHECILIGHAGHPEVMGTLGQYHSISGNIYLVESIDDVNNLQVKDENNLHYVTQTTLSIDETLSIISELKNKFNNIQGPKKQDICYATQNRQDAVKEIAKLVDVLLVIGSHNSSNTNRLKELSEICGTKSYLVDSIDSIPFTSISNVDKIGITAGASAPEELVQMILNSICNKFDLDKKNVTSYFEFIKEDITFSLPKLLRTIKRNDCNE